jgi:Zn-dependent peptidase ImmA (M78 family)/transcriptional regulator with XRE-family HTH domain
MRQLHPCDFFGRPSLVGAPRDFFGRPSLVGAPLSLSHPLFTLGPPLTGLGATMTGEPMATELAPVTPDVLKWARRSVGVNLAEAAKRAGVTSDRVERWEAGDEQPTVAKLRLLAKLYQRPLSVFFLPTPPTDFMTIRDFRRLPGDPDHTWSRSLHKVVRRALDQHDVARELLEEQGERPSGAIPAISLEDDPEVAAAVLRGPLGVTQEQFAWRKPDDALRGWIEAAESLGVMVLRTSDVDLDEMRGVSIADQALPVIVVNALDAPRGQIFSLLHELVHLAVREGGLCDTLEPDSGSARRVEAFCNAVAAAVLMPRDLFLAEEPVAAPGYREWDDDMLGYLSRRFGVSQEAVLRRLVTLQRATWDHYFDRRLRYAAIYDELRAQERAKRRMAESKGGPPPHRMAIRDRGRPFVRLVLDAYHRDAISASSVATALGLKLKHLPAVEREAR